MNSEITVTFTTDEFALLKDALERLHFLGGEQVRKPAWELIRKLNALLPSPGFSC